LAGNILVDVPENYWNYKFMEIYEMCRAKFILIKL
jgi:hypothetical protein